MNSKVANAKVVYLNANLMHTDEKLVQKWYSVINNYWDIKLTDFEGFF